MPTDDWDTAPDEGDGPTRSVRAVIADTNRKVDRIRERMDAGHGELLDALDDIRGGG